MRRIILFGLLSGIVGLCGVSGATTIEIISGTDGIGNSLPHMGSDSLTDYISGSSPEKASAIAWANSVAYPNSTNIVGGSVSQCVSSAGTSDNWAKFYYDFAIPLDMVNPVLNLDFTADDSVKVFLNNVQVGGVFTNNTMVHNIVEDNVAMFNIGGVNTLMFHVINNPGYSNWLDAGYGRGGAGDGMNIEFEGTIIPEPATLSLLLLGGLAAMRRWKA